jgi:Protein of unknown function (DUF2846)
MKKSYLSMRCAALALVVLILSPFAVAQQTMNNKAIGKLIEAGLPDSVIVNAINSNPGKYDISSAEIAALKEAGASSNVLDAIMAKYAAPETASLSKLPTATQKQASVHFYRYKQMQGSALRPSVYCDGTQVVRMSNGKYIDLFIPAGSHTFYAEDKQAGAVVMLEPGKDYYFRTDLQVGFWKGHFRLTMVTPEQGAYDLSKLKPLLDHEYEFVPSAASR